MKKKRIIPVLLLRNGWLVQSRGFSRYQNLGNPTAAVKRLSEWGSDELIYLDISRTADLALRRDDLGHPARNTLQEIMADVAKVETFLMDDRKWAVVSFWYYAAGSPEPTPPQFSLALMDEQPYFE